MNINDTSQLIEQKIKSRKTITANIVICPDTVCRQMYITGGDNSNKGCLGMQSYE